jgi:carbohydrate kinase (thermoresistant glucokinase family)
VDGGSAEVTAERPWRGAGGATIAVIMGVSGAGKTTLGRELAKRLRWNFAEGDALHPPENIAKMNTGQPLTDADRAPWLAAIARVIDSWRGGNESGVVTCSALKRAYRDQIIDGRAGVRLIYLRGCREVIAERIAARQAHFMPASLLDSQFATLEPPGLDEDPLIVDIDHPVDEIINGLISVLCSSPLPQPRGTE